jgi:hypothetical protein
VLFHALSRDRRLPSLFVTRVRSPLLPVAEPDTCTARATTARCEDNKETDHEDHPFSSYRFVGPWQRCGAGERGLGHEEVLGGPGGKPGRRRLGTCIPSKPPAAHAVRGLFCLHGAPRRPQNWPKACRRCRCKSGRPNADDLVKRRPPFQQSADHCHEQLRVGWLGRVQGIRQRLLQLRVANVDHAEDLAFAQSSA